MKKKSKTTIVSYTAARNSLAQKMAQVCADRTPLVITRQDAEACVLMSLADYQSIEETAYLLRSPNNARRLAESIEQISKGKLKSGKIAALKFFLLKTPGKIISIGSRPIKRC